MNIGSTPGNIHPPSTNAFHIKRRTAMVIESTNVTVKPYESNKQAFISYEVDFKPIKSPLRHVSIDPDYDSAVAIQCAIIPSGDLFYIDELFVDGFISHNVPTPVREIPTRISFTSSSSNDTNIPHITPMPEFDRWLYREQGPVTHPVALITNTPSDSPRCYQPFDKHDIISFKFTGYAGQYCLMDETEAESAADSAGITREQLIQEGYIIQLPGSENDFDEEAAILFSITGRRLRDSNGNNTSVYRIDPSKLKFKMLVTFETI